MDGRMLLALTAWSAVAASFVLLADTRIRLRVTVNSAGDSENSGPRHPLITPPSYSILQFGNAFFTISIPEAETLVFRTPT